VATPQELALADVEKSITFCRQVHMPVLGLIENMSGFVCPHCGHRVDVFKSGGAEKLARDMGIPFLGTLPLVPEVVEACDQGRCSVAGLENSALKEPVEKMTSKILKITESAGDSGVAPAAAEPGSIASASHQNSETPRPYQRPGTSAAHKNSQTPAPHTGAAEVRIAVPLDGDRLSAHFGHSSRFGIYDVKANQITSEEFLSPPAHAPGVLPSWLKKNGVNVVIASGLGRRASAMFEEAGITVVTGAPPEKPRDVVAAYIKGALVTGDNVCDH
jgi:predicted Fe-Mo cluster-binding NifX family protein